MGASEMSERAFRLTHGEFGVEDRKKEHNWKYATLVFPNSDEVCYETAGGAIVNLSKEDFDKIYSDTNGEVMILLYDYEKVGSTDCMLNFNEFTFIRLKGQGFNPKWNYDESTGKYTMCSDKKVISELFIS